MSGRHIDVPFEADTFGSCPAVTEVLSRVGDKWSMQVVIRLGSGSLRFNELKRVVTGISQRMLTRTLRGLERDGLVSRTVTASVPPRVDYELTPLGHSLWNPVAVLSSWALANREQIHQAQERYDAQENNDNL
ncbi:transcriptional regulator [Altererythrobacter indicus]|uniref:Transcriptional regulator n=1 Tax=Altericroceibacterium indicum TaxID=374177 RepID=A0A845AAC9_9SPHN|nr:helix-turn-helix domain-containing protein [Altericroceibacterium indicum]MXP25496.1 transcriptional regulator [Altericroceibacterium indicum]